MGLTQTQWTCDIDGAVIAQGAPVYRVASTVETLENCDAGINVSASNGTTQILCETHFKSSQPALAAVHFVADGPVGADGYR